MQKRQIQTSSNEFFKRLTPLLMTMNFAIPLGLTACASINRKEESIHAILQKENVLIEKLQAERAQPEIARAISENESLKKAEAHLSLGLEELMRANETIKAKILKTKNGEAKDGQD